MTTLITTSAILFVFGLLTLGSFAADQELPETAAAKKQDVVLFTAFEDCGVGVIIHKSVKGNAQINIYDANHTLIMKDVLPKNDDVVLKGYILNNLKDGDYTIKVTANQTVVNRTVHVYQGEHGKKSFYFAM